MKGDRDSRASRSRCSAASDLDLHPLPQLDRPAAVAPHHPVDRGGVDQLDGDDRGRTEHQRPGEQGVGAERHQQQRVQLGPQHRAAGRERVRRRSGRGGHQHPVAGPARQRQAVDLDRDLQHPLPGGLLDGDLVDRERRPDHLAVVTQRHVDGEPLLDRVRAVDHVVDDAVDLRRLRLGQEPDVAQVHAQQGGVGGDHLLRAAQDRAVAAQHQHQLDVADLLGELPRVDAHHGRVAQPRVQDVGVGFRDDRGDARGGQSLDDAGRGLDRLAPAEVREHGDPTRLQRRAGRAEASRGSA